MDFLNEQNNGLVRLDGTHLQLPTLSAWQGSSAVFWVRAPFACLAMSFDAHRPRGGGGGRRDADDHALHKDREGL